MGAGGKQLWERTRGAATEPLAGYVRREPEKTLLHEVVRDHLEDFLAEERGDGRIVPRFVAQELRRYLGCGLLARG